MAHVSRDDILKIARLARLRLTEDDLVRYGTELDAILNYVDQLQSIDTTSVKPTVQVTGLVNVMRDDEVINYQVSTDELLENAPDKESGSFKVRRVI